MNLRRTSWLALLILLSTLGAEAAPKDTKRLKELQKQLRNFEPRVRMEAIRELESMGSDKAVDLLSTAAREEQDWEVQIRAIEALATLKSAKSLHALTWLCLKGEVILVRRAAREALKACDDGTAFKRIRAALSPRDPDARQYAMTALGRLGGEDALRLVIQHFGDREAEVKVAAAAAAAESGDATVLPALLRLRRLKDPIVKISAILALARFDHEDVYPVLIEELVRANDDYLTRRLVRAVAKYESEGLIESIRGYWGKLKGLGKARICRLLGATKRESAIDLLLEALTDREALVRADAARALGRAGNPRVVDALTGLMKDSSGTVRLMALWAIHALVPESGRLEVVRMALANDEPELRVQGCVMAADDGIKEAILDIAKLIDASLWEEATAAMIAVGRLGNALETDLFLPALKNRDWRIRATAVEAMFLLRHTSVLEPMIDMTVDPHVNVRSAAVKSLQVLTQQRFDSEPDKWRRWLEANKGTFEITKKGVVVEGGEKDRYAKDRYLVEILKKARLLVVLGKWDKVQIILDDLNIPHTMIRVQQLKTIGLNPKQLILFNCEGGGGVDRESTETLRWFVNTGGYIITTDWALQNVVKDVWPGLMAKWEKNTTRNDAVAIEPALPEDPILRGVFDHGLPLKWWLEIQAFAIEILDPFRVDVLVDSLEMLDRYTLSPMLARFTYGHGKVMNSVSHFYLQKEGIATLTGKRERMIFAADHLGLSFKAIRDLADRGFFDKQDTEKVTKDYSMFRLIVNFVDEKKRRVEQE